MSERERQRRLSVEGRLADLRAKHGPEDRFMPPWLDTYEGWLASRPLPGKSDVEEEAPVVQPVPKPSESRPVQRSAKRLPAVWERDEL